MTSDKIDYKFFILATIGALVILYGHTFEMPQMYYIIGSTLLLISAIRFNLVYFIALELILCAGHTAVLLGIGPYTQSALPILLSFQLLVFYIMLGKENNIFLIIGIVGIALLSLGFSYNDQWIFFFGSFFIAIYAYYLGIKGVYPAYVWAILNSVFTFTALTKLYTLNY